MSSEKRPDYERARGRAQGIIDALLSFVCDEDELWGVIGRLRKGIKGEPAMMCADSFEASESYVEYSARASLVVERGIAKRGRRIVSGLGW